MSGIIQDFVQARPQNNNFWSGGGLSTATGCQKVENKKYQQTLLKHELSLTPCMHMQSGRYTWLCGRFGAFSEIFSRYLSSQKRPVFLL